MHFRMIPRSVSEMSNFLTKKQPTQGCFDDSFERFADAPENEPPLLADGNTSLLRLLSNFTNSAMDSNGESDIAQVKVNKSVLNSRNLKKSQQQ